jgi:hypothetical protein
MFRPLYIFRFSVQYSVRKCLYLVGQGGERDPTLQCVGGIRLTSGVLGALPEFGLLLLSMFGVLHMGGDCFRSGGGGYALFHVVI